MDGLEDKLNAILSDPDAMGRIADMAKSLFGDGVAERKKPEAPSGEAEETLLRRAAQLLRGNSLRQDETALLSALRPFLSEERRSRLDRAIKIARLASLARLAGEFTGIGGEEDV